MQNNVLTYFGMVGSSAAGNLWPENANMKQTSVIISSKIHKPFLDFHHTKSWAECWDRVSCKSALAWVNPKKNHGSDDNEMVQVQHMLRNSPLQTLHEILGCSQPFLGSTFKKKNLSLLAL